MNAKDYLGRSKRALSFHQIIIMYQIEIQDQIEIQGPHLYFLQNIPRYAFLNVFKTCFSNESITLFNKNFN